MIVINYGHPLGAEVLAAIAEATKSTIGRVYSPKVSADVNAPFSHQATALVEAIGMTPEEWQRVPLIVVPPGLAPLTCAILAEIHGRRGHFPVILRMKNVAIAPAPPVFGFAEIIDLQGLRDDARRDR